MKGSASLIVALACLAFVAGCTDLSKEDRRYSEIIGRIEREYAPDPRMAVFGVSFTRTNKGIALAGEIDNEAAKRALLDSLSPFVKRITDDIALLPEAKLGSRVRGIISVSVADMHRDPDDSSELVSQAIMGSFVKILRESDEWSFVQTDDKYLGWMRQGLYIQHTKSELDTWSADRRAIVLAASVIMHETPKLAAPGVGELVAGSVVRWISGEGGWTKIELPDGRVGFVLSSAVSDYESWRKSTKPTAEGVEKVARSFLGVPYLWGGTSARAMDCSGFTKTVYMLNGVQLSRDANQQAQEGVPVIAGPKFENLREGDLLFFGRKGNEEKPGEVLHVVMYLKDRTFIHASGTVKINSLDPASPLFDPNKLRSFICARRILPQEKSGVSKISRR